MEKTNTQSQNDANLNLEIPEAYLNVEKQSDSTIEKTTISNQDVTNSNVEKPASYLNNEIKADYTLRNTNIKKQNQANLTFRRLIYYFLSALEILFGFRFVLKILGSNPASPFVKIIYSTSKIFIAPFVGIFRVAVTEGIEAKSVLEPSLIIAMLVYAVVAWGVVKLIEIVTNRKDSQIL